MQITHTITLLELIWTVNALIGFFFMLRLLWRAIQDREWLIESKSINGDRRLRKYVSVTSILIYLGGAVTQFSYSAIGFVAMTQANLHAQVTAAQILTSAIFIGSSIVGSVLAYHIFKRREYVVKTIMEDYARREHA